MSTRTRQGRYARARANPGNRDGEDGLPLPPAPEGRLPPPGLPPVAPNMPMPPPDLGAFGNYRDNDDDDGDDDGSSDASDHSSQTGSEGSEAENEDEPDPQGNDPVPQGNLNGNVFFEIPFHEKLQSFGLTEPQVDFIVLNGATSPNTFARLFTSSALDALFKTDLLRTIMILVMERVKMFHRWLNERHSAGESLTGISLDRFTDTAMASLVEADSRGSVRRGHDGATSKGTGLSLPTFNGVQANFKVWNQKWRAYLGTLKNTDGIPLLYVIVQLQKEKASVRRQLQGASLKGSQFQTDNFKVSQLLESALADGSAYIYTSSHSGDGRRAYLELVRQYAGSFRQETRVQEIMAKLKSIQYRGVKNFPWDKFTSVLLGHYEELKILDAKVGQRTQVRNLLDMIHHDKTRQIAADIISSNKRVKENLKKALAKIGERMQLLGMMSGGGTNDGGLTPPSSRLIKKLQRKVKAFQKKHPKRGDKQDSGFIPKGILDAIRKAGGDDGGKYVSMILNGKKRPNEDRSAKTMQSVTEEEYVDESALGDNEEEEVPGNASASSAFGRGAANRHATNPNKKARTIGALRVESYKVSKTVVTRIETPTDYAALCRAEVDSRADTVCCGKTFRMIEQSQRIATVSGFHGALGAVSDIPIANCVTAIDHPLLQETLILVCNEALYFGATMEDSLISPNQLRANGIVVDTCPKQYSAGKSMHGIYDPTEDVFIPFKMHGCISYFASRLPTDEELASCRRIVLTSEQEWDPYSPTFAQEEEAYTQGAITSSGEHFSADGNRSVFATSSHDRRTTVDSVTLGRRWGTSVSTASKTLQATTTRAVRFYPEDEFSRRFRTRQAQLRFPHLRTKFYSDTFFSETKSIRGYKCAQLFCNDEGWATVKPLRSKADCGDALNDVIREVGIPNGIHTDNAGEESGVYTEWERVRKSCLIPNTFIEPHSPWMNRAEGEIGKFKTHFRRIMNRWACPESLWCFGATYTSKIRELMSRPSLNDRSALETLTGETPDISEYTDFDFYQFVLYYDPNDDSVDDKGRRKLARWLGPSGRVGQGLCYYLLKPNGRYIARSTVRPIRPDDYEKYPTLKEDLKEFDRQVKEHVGTFDSNLILQTEADDPEEAVFSPPAESDTTFPNDEADFEDPDTPGFDPLVRAQVILPHKGGDMMATVMGRKRDLDGNLIGRKHNIPVLDSRAYEVEFLDGERQQVSYNLLAEHLLSQVDEDGNQYQLFKEIVDHRKDPKRAVEKADQMSHRGGKSFKKKTTAGWQLEVEWRDGTTSWLPLKTLKETNPVQVAEYARGNQIDLEPAFDWWVPIVLRRRNRLIKGALSRHQRTGFKFGIRLPTSIKSAKELDRENGNTLWADALQKEMSAVMVAFDVQPEEVKFIPGYKRIPGHLVWDVKMDFTRKARYVAGGHRTDPPKALTYSSVVSRESVRIAMLIAGLNDLDIRLADIGNAYLTAPTTEKCYVVAGDEFGPDLKGRTLKIVRALYGLKSAGAAFRAHLASILRTFLKFQPCQADPDVWMRRAHSADGNPYYEYILVYVDDVMIISGDPDAVVNSLKEHFLLKVVSNPADKPERYLGAMIGKHQFSDGTQAWYMSADDYLSKAIPTVEEACDEKLNKKFTSPLPPDYHPELDTSPFLNDDGVSLFASYIGILQWAGELGRVDLAHSVALMSRFRCAPREGHLDMLLRMFGYVKGHLRSKLVFDPAYRDWTQVDWNTADWKEFYPDAAEPIPPGAPEPLGNEVQLNIFCDAAHATCLATRRSTTGILIFLNGGPIRWYSKRQNTIESSTFGSEFVAMKIAMEMNAALRYKLRMMGVPIEGASNTFGDNASVIKNVTFPESTLHKRHNSIAYHKCREECAGGAARVAHEPGKENCSDGLTKILPGPAFKAFVRSVLH